MVDRISVARPSRLRVLMLASVMLPILVAVPTAVPSVYALGVLYLNPSQQGPFPVGTMLNYTVKVASMDPFNGWDASVQSDASVLNPVSITVEGNMFHANFSTDVLELTNCINGSGSGCTINDGGGIAHSVAVSSTGATASGNGLLFTITYRVMGSGFSLVTIPLGFDSIFNGANIVSHSTSSGSYGARAQPSFTLTSSPASFTVNRGSFGTSAITLTSVGDFAGNVSLSTAVSHIVRCTGDSGHDECEGAAGPRVLLSNSTFTSRSVIVALVSGGTSSATLNFTARRSTLPITYTVNVTGTSGSLQTFTLITVSVVDFSLSASPGRLLIPVDENVNFTLTVAGLDGFAGNVVLSVAVRCGLEPNENAQNCPIATLHPTTIALSPTTTSGTSILTVFIPQDTHRPDISISVSATSGSLVHSITLKVVVVHHDSLNRFDGQGNDPEID